MIRENIITKLNANKVYNNVNSYGEVNAILIYITASSLEVKFFE